MTQPRLPKGIGIIALGGYDADTARLPRAVSRFEARGWRVKTAPDPSQRHQRFAATDAIRLNALRAMLEDPEADVVMALRGSYGITRLLDSIDFDILAAAIRERGKRLVGHSDVTALQLALLARTGAVSFSGPMASYDFGGESASPFMEENFWPLMERQPGTVRHAVEFPAIGPSCNVHGTLWGGNLAMLCSLIGTPWMPHIEGGILFLEDVNEHPYRIERMLLQLHQCGVLGNQQAVLLGDFSGYKVNGYDNGYDLGAAIDCVRARVRIPVITGLPFGHCPDKLTLPVGGQAELELASGHCRMMLRC